MKKLMALAVLVTVAVTILAPVGFGVNSPSVNNSTLWADGCGSPVPPMPVLFEETSTAAQLGGSAIS